MSEEGPASERNEAKRLSVTAAGPASDFIRVGGWNYTLKRQANRLTYAARRSVAAGRNLWDWSGSGDQIGYGTIRTAAGLGFFFFRFPNNSCNLSGQSGVGENSNTSFHRLR
jgi:hypothetical protein